MIRVAYLLLPFAYISFGTIYRGQQLFLLMCAFILTVCRVRNIAVKWFMFYVVAWVLWIMVSNMVAGKPNIESVNAFSIIVYFWIAAAVFLAVSESTVPITKLINVLCIAAIMQAVMAVSQRLGFDPFFWATSKVFDMQRGLSDTALTGTLGNPNYLAGFLAISLPFFLRKYWIYCLPLFCVVFYLAQTSTAVIAAAVAVVVFYRNKWVTLSAIAVAVVYILTDNHYNPVYQDIRWVWWGDITAHTINTWQTAIFGFGPGASGGRSYPLHNEWVTMFHQFGAVGLIFAILYIITIPLPDKFSSIEYRMLFSALTAAAVGCIGNHSLHLAPSAFLILIVMGLIERKKNGGLSDFSESC